MGTDPITYWVVLAISTAYQYTKQKAMQREMEQKAKNAAAMRDIRVSGSNNPVPIAYGYNRIEGIDVYANVNDNFIPVPASSSEVLFGTLDTFEGKRNNVLILQKVLANAPISSVIHAEIDEIDFDKEDYLTWVRLYTNKNGGTANASPTLQRDATATFNGLAYATEYFRMNRDKPQFNGKPATAYYIEGRPIRTFSGTTLLTNKTFSNNAAEVLLDYLLDTEVGVGLTTDDIDLLSFSEAARISKQVVKANAEIHGKIFEKRSITTLNIIRHQFNGRVYPDQDHISNIEAIVEVIPGAILFRDTKGKIKLSLPDSAKTSSEVSAGTITDDILISDIEYSQPDSNDKLNRVKLTYANSGKDFASDSYEYKNQTYLEEDNNIILSTEITLAGVSNVYQASGIAKAIVNETRVASYRFETSHQALHFEPGDVVRLTSLRNDIDRYVRITNMRMNEEFAIEVDAVAYDPSIYVYDSTVIENNYNRPGFDFSIGQATNFGANLLTSDTAFIGSIELTWTDADDIAVAEYIIDAGLFINDALVYNTIGIVPSGTERLIHSPTYPATYYYRIRSRTTLGKMSPWSEPITLNIEPIQVVNGLSILFSTYNMEFKRDIAGNTLPVSQSATISIVLGDVLATYQTANTLLNNEWKIISPLTGDLDNSLGSYEITIAANVATITVTLDQGYTANDFGLISIPIEIKYNSKASALSILDPQLFSISRSITVLDVVDGVDGNDGVVFRIANSSPIFKKDETGAISPSSIVLETFLQNVEGTPNYSWFKNNSLIIGANSSSYTVLPADFATLSLNTYKCTVSGMINGVVSAVSDEVTIPLLLDGASAVQVFNSNQSVTFTAPSAGYAGIDFDGGSSTITVFIGDNQLAYSGTGANTFSATNTSTNASVAQGLGSGNTFVVPQPTAMTAENAYTDVTITVRNGAGTVSIYTTRISYSLSRTGIAGNQTATVRLYQWSTAYPGEPNGSSQYAWISGTHSNYTGTNGWSTTVPPNPEIPLIKLWEASKTLVATADSTITAVDWTEDYSIVDVTQNGAAGTQSIDAAVYRWEPTIPAGPTGTSVYTWATGNITPIPSGWSLTPGTSPSPGYTLWKASVRLLASVMDTTSNINWTTAGITAAGYAGDDGQAASLLYLSSTAQAFTFLANGTADPADQTISFTANLQVLAGTAVFVATRYNSSNSSIDTITLGGSGNTRTLTSSQFGNAAYCVVTATLGDFSDQVTIVAIYDGATGANGQNAIVGYLTNEAVTVQADSSGTVSSFSGASGTFKVFNGLTDVTGTSVTYSVVSESGVDVSISTAGVYTVNSMSANSGTATLRAVYNTVTIDKVYSIAKSLAGATGTSGTAGASARLMFARIAGSTNPVSGTVTVSGDVRPTGAQAGAVWGSAFNVTWSAIDPDPASENTLWQSDGIYSPSTGNTVWATPYISNLKVGTLSAITANTGNLNVSGQIKASTATRSGSTMTAGQAGAIIQSDGTFSIGRGFITGDGTANPNGKNITFDGTNFTINGDVVVTGNLTANAVTSSSFAYSSVQYLVTASPTWQDVPNVNITLSNNTSTAFVELNTSAILINTGTRVVRSDGTLLTGVTNGTFVDQNPPTGATTYKMQVRRITVGGIDPPYSIDESLLIGTIFKR